MFWFHNDPSVLSHKAPVHEYDDVFFSQCFKYFRVSVHLLSEEEVAENTRALNSFNRPLCKDRLVG